MNIIKINNVNITIFNKKNEDYICLSHIAKLKKGNRHIRNWMKNSATIEFLILWEQLNNKNFNVTQMGNIKKETKLNNFTMTPDKWVNKTNSIGIISKRGRYGGIYAHKDIALEFAMWLSPIFKLWLLKEFQKLKKHEQNNFDSNWNLNRSISKRNYSIQTESIKTYLIPKFKNQNNSSKYFYTSEADMLNIILWNMTAKQWRDKNIELVSKGKNIRDTGSIN